MRDADNSVLGVPDVPSHRYQNPFGSVPRFGRVSPFAIPENSNRHDIERPPQTPHTGTESYSEVVSNEIVLLAILSRAVMF